MGLLVKKLFVDINITGSFQLTEVSG